MSAVDGSRASTPRILFFGTRGAFSGPPLAALLAAGIPVAAVVLPPDRARAHGTVPPPIRPLPQDASLPMLGHAPTVPDLAREHGLPLFELSRPGDPEALARLAAFRPDLICVACFPRLLPRALLDLPRRGCLNLHPSLLPRHRGPEPLFWTFYHGDAVAGASIHIMDEGGDTGDLLLQTPVPIPDSITGPELERACADAGAALLPAAVHGRAGGSLLPRPQPQDGATYAPRPEPRDLEIPLTWTARRAFHFIRGVGAWYPLTIRVPGRRPLRIREALGVVETPVQGRYTIEGSEARVRFEDSVLRLALARSEGRNSLSQLRIDGG